MRTFTKDTALLEQGRGTTWHVWINARHGRGKARARHRHGRLCLNPPLWCWTKYAWTVLLLFSPVTIHHDRSPTTKTVAYVNKQTNKQKYIYVHTWETVLVSLWVFNYIILLRYVRITHPYFFPKIPSPWHWQQSLANDGAELWFECQVSKVSNTFIYTAQELKFYYYVASH
jgi:hypothetical protein